MYSLSTRFFRSELPAFICHSWFNPFVHIITLSNLVWNGHPASFSRWFLSDLSMCILILSNSIRLCPLRSFAISFELITQLVLSQNQFLSDPFVSAVTDQFGTILSSVSYCIRSWFSLCFLIHAQRCSFFTAERIRQCDIRNSYVDREKRERNRNQIKFSDCAFTLWIPFDSFSCTLSSFESRERAIECRIDFNHFDNFRLISNENRSDFISNNSCILPQTHLINVRSIQ